MKGRKPVAQIGFYFLFSTAFPSSKHRCVGPTETHFLRTMAYLYKMPFWAFIQAQSSIGIDQTNRNFEKIFEKTWAVPFPFAELPTSDGKKRIQLEAVAFLVNSTSISNQRQRKKIGELLYSILLNEKNSPKICCFL